MYKRAREDDSTLDPATAPLVHQYLRVECVDCLDPCQGYRTISLVTSLNSHVLAPLCFDGNPDSGRYFRTSQRRFNPGMRPLEMRLICEKPSIDLKAQQLSKLLANQANNFLLLYNPPNERQIFFFRRKALASPLAQRTHFTHCTR